MAGLVRLLLSEAQRVLSRLWKVEQEAEAPNFFLEAPRTEKLLERGEVGGLRYGLGAMQGWRAHMEDAHSAQLQLPGTLAGWAFFAVYDGHAGSSVARFCARHLLEHLLAAEALTGPEEDPEAVKEGVREAFLALDRRMQALAQAEGWEHAGSTAVAVLVSPRRLYFINLGDSRALLCRAASVTFYTQDHKPSRPAERKRIENAGGSVLLERVNGSLAVSRALGDFDYKAVAWRGPTEQLVSPEPEVYELPRCPAADEFLVLACDGVWDAFDNAGLCAFVRARLSLTGDPQDACECVLDASLYKVSLPPRGHLDLSQAKPSPPCRRRCSLPGSFMAYSLLCLQGSRDNMTCIVVCFPAAPGVSREALQKERELDAHLESRVAGECDFPLPPVCRCSLRGAQSHVPPRPHHGRESRLLLLPPAVFTLNLYAPPLKIQLRISSQTLRKRCDSLKVKPGRPVPSLFQDGRV